MCALRHLLEIAGRMPGTTFFEGNHPTSTLVNDSPHEMWGRSRNGDVSANHLLSDLKGLGLKFFRRAFKRRVSKHASLPPRKGSATKHIIMFLRCQFRDYFLASISSLIDIKKFSNDAISLVSLPLFSTLTEESSFSLSPTTRI